MSTHYTERKGKRPADTENVPTRIEKQENANENFNNMLLKL